MDERFRRIFHRQQASGFRELDGAEASATIPLSKALLNELLAEVIPSSIPVRDLDVVPHANDRFIVSGRFGSSALLPRLRLTIAVDQQPTFPDSPVLVLRLETTGLLSIAGPALRMMNALPAGVRVDHDRVYVDLRVLLHARGLDQFLDVVRELRVGAVDGKAILFVRLKIEP